MHLGDPQHAFTMNVLAGLGGDPAVERSATVNGLIRLMKNTLWPDVQEAFGPMFELYFRNALLLLMEAQGDAATILDFKVVEGDRIDVAGIDSGAANARFTFIYDQAFSAAGQLRATVENGELVIQGNTDADLTTVEFSFTLVGVLSIRESDFVL